MKIGEIRILERKRWKLIELNLNDNSFVATKIRGIGSMVGHISIWEKAKLIKK